MSTIPLGRFEDRGVGLGWAVLDEGRPRLVDESTVLIAEDVMFGGKATALEEEGIALEETILGKRLARKAWVR